MTSPTSGAANNRLEDFKAEVAEIKAGGGQQSPIERRLFQAATFALASGLIFTLLGWAGASRTPFLFEQIPYLISGGLFGLGLTFLGGFLYFGYWLALMVAESRRQSDVTAQALLEIRDLLERNLASGHLTNGHASAPGRARDDDLVPILEGEHQH